MPHAFALRAGGQFIRKIERIVYQHINENSCKIGQQ